ncbi:Dysbindin [Desmophyllum pertusum]|uniref:Dysbindin n=1 Tax=Desmophyllum pertusum TaxID=174260 RepID=A0A9W9ZNE6_9CNID|nr:Dysbindin [Desmophyllum pertusum]
MFDNFRDRLQTVQHDLTQGWKSIADKAKAVNKKLVRKTTFITDEIVESGDQCFSCNLEAGSEILSKYQKQWAEIHEASRECAGRAQSADQIISEFSKKCSELHTTMSMFHSELALLPEVIKNIETAKADIDAFGGQIEVLDNLMMDLEEACEKLDLERRKAAQGLKLSMLRHNREDDLEVLKEELQSARERKAVKLLHLERQASIEKRQVYEDAFLEQMNYYIQYGKTEEPISMLHSRSRSSGSLDDVMLEDDTELHTKELDDFFGSETEPSEVPSGVDKEQTTVGLSSEDEELLNQNLPSHTAESTAQNATEKESTDVVKENKEDSEQP